MRQPSSQAVSSTNPGTAKTLQEVVNEAGGGGDITDLGVVSGWNDVVDTGVYKYVLTTENGISGLLLVTSSPKRDGSGKDHYQVRIEAGKAYSRTGESLKIVEGRYTWNNWEEVDGGVSSAENVSYNNGATPEAAGLTNVQEAIDHLFTQKMSSPSTSLTTREEVESCDKAGNYGVSLNIGEEPYPILGEMFSLLVLNMDVDSDQYTQVGVAYTGDGYVMAVRGGSSDSWSDWQEIGGMGTSQDVTLPTISVFMENSIKGDGKNKLYVAHGTLSPALMALNPTLELCRMKRTGNSEGKSTIQTYMPKRKKKWCAMDASNAETSSATPRKWHPLNTDSVIFSCPVNTNGYYRSVFSVYSNEETITDCKEIARFIVRKRDNAFYVPSDKIQQTVVDLAGKKIVKGKIGIRLRVDNPAFTYDTPWDENRGKKKYLYSNVCPLLVSAHINDERTDAICFLSPTYG